MCGVVEMAFGVKRLRACILVGQEKGKRAHFVPRCLLETFFGDGRGWYEVA